MLPMQAISPSTLHELCPCFRTQPVPVFQKPQKEEDEDDDEVQPVWKKAKVQWSLWQRTWAWEGLSVDMDGE